jgi:hypothetical protein
VAKPEEIAQLSPISRILTFWLVEIGDELAVFGGEPGDYLLNPIGTLHGGWAMTLRARRVDADGDGRDKMTRRPPYRRPPAAHAVL